MITPKNLLLIGGATDHSAPTGGGYLPLFVLLLLWSLPQPSNAEDCLASTNPPYIVEEYPGVLNESLDEDAGFYLASLKNGDQIMVRFSQCELSLRGHYFSRHGNDIDATAEKFLSYILPSRAHSKKLVKKLRQHGKLSPNESALLEGVGDQHKLTVTDSSSRLFLKEIHYEWFPPIH